MMPLSSATLNQALGRSVANLPARAAGSEGRARERFASKLAAAWPFPRTVGRLHRRVTRSLRRVGARRAHAATHPHQLAGAVGQIAARRRARERLRQPPRSEEQNRSPRQPSSAARAKAPGGAAPPKRGPVRSRVSVARQTLDRSIGTGRCPTAPSSAFLSSLSFP
jgi:hypothetical protein